MIDNGHLICHNSFMKNVISVEYGCRESGGKNWVKQRSDALNCVDVLKSRVQLK